MEVVLDFETANPLIDLPTVGSTVYAQHWATEILCLSYHANGVEWLWAPADNGMGRADAFLRELSQRPAAMFIAHNAGFEKDIWREIMVPTYGFPDIPNDRWHDTMASAAYRVVPLSLEKCLKVLGLVEKDMAGSKITRSLSRFDRKGYLPKRTPELMQRIYAYCQKDVADETALHTCLGCLPPIEHRVWLLDQRINERGVALDRQFLRGARHVVDAARGPLVSDFAELTGGIEPSKVAQVVAWVRSQGVEIENLQKGTIAGLLGETEDDDDEDVGERRSGRDEMGALAPNVRRALSIRSLVGSAAVRKLSRMEGCIARDGRVHRLLQYHGTGPGRWAGRLFNPLNFPRGLVRDPVTHKAPDPELLAAAITTGEINAVDALGTVVEDGGRWRAANPIEVVASALRHAIVSGDDRRFVVGDFAGIQARTVLALAGQHDKTALLASGADVYLDMAEDINGVPKGSLTKADVELRQGGKGGVLGGGFQCGPDNFCQKFVPGCLCRRGWTGRCRNRESEAFKLSDRTIYTYRKIWAPCVPKLWYALEEAALRTVWDGRPYEAYGIRYELDDGWLTARLLDGKKIYYWNPRKAKQQLPWDHTQSKDCWTYQTTKNGQLVTVHAYGGLQTENVVMGLERQLLVRAMFRCEAENLPVIFNGYDEIVAEPELAYAKWEHLKQIMEDRPAWAEEIKLPIAAEGWVGSRYRKG